MNAGDDIAPTHWSRQRWIFITLLLFCGQCVAIYFLGQPPPQPAPTVPSSSQTIFAAVVEPTLGAEHPLGLAAIPSALSPRDLRARAHQTIPYPLDDAPPTERRLGIATRAEQLGRPPSTELPSWSNLTETLPELPGTPQARIRPSARTTTRVVGALRQRKLITPAPAIEWTSPEPIQTTVTEVMVNGQGRVISEKLIEPSGNKTADALALEASRRLRFESVEGIKAATVNHPSNLVWGRILFQWGIPNPDTPSNR